MVGLIIALTLLGLLLLALEVIVPGMIVGVVGVLTLLAAIILSYIHFGVGVGSLMLAGILAVAFAGFLLWLYLFPRTFVGRRLTLTSAIRGSGRSEDLPGMVGRTGVALTHLRPAGTATIDGKRIDVVAESSFINANEPVRVLSVDGMRVVVRRETA